MQWIEPIYVPQSAEVWIKGNKSGRFNIGMGVHQGCLLSPLLFDLTIEMLALAVHQSQIVQGLKIQSKGNKLMLCPDVLVFVMIDHCKL